MRGGQGRRLRARRGRLGPGRPRRWRRPPRGRARGRGGRAARGRDRRPRARAVAGVARRARRPRRPRPRRHRVHRRRHPRPRGGRRPPARRSAAAGAPEGRHRDAPRGAQPAGAVGLAKAVDADPALDLASAFTHCAVADEPGNPFTDVQLARFDAVLDDIARAGIAVPCQHAANTAAAIDHPGARRDLVRVGIGLYGIDPSPALAGRVALAPALSLHARTSHVKRVAAGEGISYGLRYRPERETTIATVPLGYADGLPRRLGELGGSVLLGGRPRPIAGSVTMDQILVDCGDDPVEVGDEVVLIGRQGDLEVTAADWAARLGTIAYEVVCAISPRVPRRYLEGAS
ncbi:MAG: alanine racemase [Acidimicrobiales bacterium]